MAKKPRRRAAQQPYDPLQSPYPTVGAFNNAVRKTARTQIQPALNELNTQGRYESGAHNTRTGQISGWYGGLGDVARASASGLQDATRSLLSSVQAGNQGGYDAMSAALGKINADAAANARQLGVAPQTPDPNALLAAGAYGQGGNLSVISDIAAQQARANAMAPIAAQSGIEAGQQENARFDATKRDMQAQRRGLMGQMPGLMEQARNNLSQTELARAGQAFQQGLARDQFGEQVLNDKSQRSATRAQTRLAQDTFGEQKRAARVSERQRETELGISQQNADTQRQQVAASAGNDTEVAKARAKQFDSGVTILANAWKSTDLDKVYDPPSAANGYTKTLNPQKTAKQIERRMKGQFDSILDQISASTGLGPLNALRVMMAAPNSGWRKEAQKRFAQLKRARKNAAVYADRPDYLH